MRKEKDSMGEMNVPEDALYGASTQRAVLNFPISHETLSDHFISAFGLIKWGAAEINGKLGIISEEKAELISAAAREVYEGVLSTHFPVDIYQTGSGTSTNMNVNEVIANRCAQISNIPLNSDKNKKMIHPNDDVNQSQSSNDTFPTAMHIALALQIKNFLIPELESLRKSLKNKEKEFSNIIKIGRTHLMDATPITLGQEFSGYGRQIEIGIERAKKSYECLLELPLGGTAVGTGLNCHEDFARLVIEFISQKTGINFKEASNHFEAQASKDSIVESHGQIVTINTSLYKIANDIRLMSSGPRCSLGEIILPSIQPGSSIMPGKVNPVISEAVTMVAARVFGNQTTITWAGANGHLELNTFMPVMIFAALESIKLTTNGCKVFREKCIDGIKANHERCESLIEQSLSMVTSLAPIIGYDVASKIAKQSIDENKSVRELCLEKLSELNITKKELDEILNPYKMANCKK
ncbi:MAG: class II fumarate hydratase [Verrucomicrobiota bacterium]|nr:class II fumarate hydratase [Verrucomicrobiota bacterium]